MALRPLHGIVPLEATRQIRPIHRVDVHTGGTFELPHHTRTGGHAGRSIQNACFGDDASTQRGAAPLLVGRGRAFHSQLVREAAKLGNGRDG